MKLALIAVALIVITALGLYVGWAMDHSHLPPHGGGWRCYVACIALVWALPLGTAGLLSLPALCRRITRILAA